MWHKLVGPHLAPKLPWLGLFASALAFSFILSLVPFLVVTVSLAQHYLPFDFTPPIIALLKKILPPDAQLDVQSVVNAANRIAQPKALTLGLLGAVWTCLNFMHLLAHALHFIFADPESSLHASWRTWLRSVGLFTIWMTCLIATCFLLLYSTVMQGWLAQTHLWPVATLIVIKLAALLVLFAMIYSALYWTYWLTPSHRPNLRRTRFASFFTATGWFATCSIFAWVLPAFWKTNFLYGALGSIVALLLWAYICAWIVLLGACAIARKFSLQSQPAA